MSKYVFSTNISVFQLFVSIFLYMHVEKCILRQLMDDNPARLVAKRLAHLEQGIDERKRLVEK